MRPRPTPSTRPPGPADAGPDVAEPVAEAVATLSHELRAPLAGIAGFVELLQDGTAGPLTPHQAQCLDAVARSTRRLRDLVEDLMALAGIDAGADPAAYDVVDVRDAVRAAEATLRPLAAESEVRLRVELPGVPVPVRGDVSRLESLVTNLTANAVKFAPEDGHVRCRLEVAGDAVRLEVSDDGVGIPAAEQPRVFERFFRASTARGVAGTGLGLAIVDAVARAHGGTVEVRSAPGRGTTFTVELPRAEPQPPEPGVVSSG